MRAPNAEGTARTAGTNNKLLKRATLKSMANAREEQIVETMKACPSETTSTSVYTFCSPVYKIYLGERSKARSSSAVLRLIMIPVFKVLA
jgi:hypothetical protein